MKAAEWIDRVKTVNGWATDYRVAKELGISTSRLANYRIKPMTLDEEMSLKIAGALHERPEMILIDQAAERAKTEEARSVYRGILGRLGGVAASVSLTACVVVLGVSSPTPAQAQTHVDASPPLCIMLSRIIMRLLSVFVAKNRPQSSAGLLLC